MDVEVVVALITAGVAIGVAGTNAWEGRRRQREDFLLSALTFLGGGTQKRSAGIAIAQALHKKGRRLRPALVPHLVNQLMYLQTVQQEKDAAAREHEHDNVRRLADLLREIGEFDKYASSYRALCRAVRGRKDGSGIPVPHDSDAAQSLEEFYRALPREFEPPDRTEIVGDSCES